ncbi:efflux RND transporter permease subunit [Polycyclovorans algicola]|uniref:efflux RND transporter permease subunit n=1 Tax=Polycyclovorans algicola TaxID=616992 RepID=UPI0004A70569|nr:MMPL family transporter [Polycyclovorans algicola]
MPNAFSSAFHRLVLDMPWVVALFTAALLAVAGYQGQRFKLDASADSLILEGDEDLAYYRDVSGVYGTEEFLVVTYSPDDDLFSEASLARLKRLKDELAALEQVASVMSILDVPLVDSPRVTLSEIQESQRTLLDEDTDPALAKQEFLTSPIYKDLVLNPGADTTAMLVNLRSDEEAARLLERREALRAQRDQKGLSTNEAVELDEVTAAYAARTAELQVATQTLIDEVRVILNRYRDESTIFLGGVPMIAADMIDYVRGDIRSFGIGVGLFIVALLAVSFRRAHWVIVPSAICAVVTVVMVGFLGFMDWRVTIVSSNFISLLLIITLSLSIHLIVRHRELHAESPNRSQRELLRDTINSKFMPSLFTALTTMVSFASLIVSDIRPVIDFGLMMTWGVLFAFLLTFLLFPAALVGWSLGRAPSEGRDITARFNLGLAALVDRAPGLTWFGFVLLLIGGAIGINRLTVENRFIDYFHDSTEIYQGMLEIDRELGGTTPVDVIIDAPKSFYEEQAYLAELAAEDDYLAEELDGGLSSSSYWYNEFRQDEVHAIHDYLDALPQTGKVLSLSSSLRMAQMVNNDQPLGNFEMALAHRLLPADVKASLFDPYMSPDGNQLRFAVRVVDSDPSLRRDDLLRQIERELVEEVGLEPEQVNLTGMMVLYNNVMQSLFESQLATLVVVFLAISAMFWILFGSFKMALIGVVPTLVAAVLVLGLMGWLNIPLDIMTITIAAITIGIGVHDTIHYTHRYRDEVQQHGDEGAVQSCHASVGRAMAYTTLVVALGFSILALSNFVPTIYFGLFTGAAMLIALFSNLTLLPLLLVRLKPFTRTS